MTDQNQINWMEVKAYEPHPDQGQDLRNALRTAFALISASARNMQQHPLVGVGDRNSIIEIVCQLSEAVAQAHLAAVGE